ncbi:MAG: hypothetical protein HN849_14915 [Victivallales bacterium]|nr:hypothetical protein [Victivallales bacterium]MBT7300809.1 hypothetical protein [Victivallales bacterium]
MKAKNKALRTYLFSTIGLVVMAVLLVSANLILGAINLRWDCTEENVHTLSKGTREILAKVDTNVAIRFYFSRDVAQLPMALKNYAARVEDLLKEYRRYGKGNISVTKMNPKPDSDAEDSARMDGVQARPSGYEPFYFGLAVTCLDETETIATLSPDAENTLEYDITRAVHRVLHPDKPRIGVLSSLPVMGKMNQPNPMMGMRGGGQTPPWVFVNALKSDYEVEEIQKDIESVPPGVDVLLLVHPKELSEKTLFAIDQYVLQGGRVLAFMDVMSLAEQRNAKPSMMGMAPPGGPSSLGPLLDAWGIEFEGLADEPNIIADSKFMLQSPGNPGQPARVFPTVLSLGPDAINKDEIAVGQLEDVWYANGGSFAYKGETGLTRTKLLFSSEKAGFVETFKAMSLDPVSGGRILDDLKTDETSHVLALRLEGTFTTAFPAGMPSEEAKEGEEKKDDASLKKSSENGVVVLFGDSDMISNDIAFRPVGGGPGRPPAYYVPSNDNINLLMNLLEWLSGDNNLISLRSRGIKRRPLTLFNDMLTEAREESQSVMKELEEEMQETVKKLGKLMEKTPPVKGMSYHQSPEMRDEIKKLEEKQKKTKERQKELRKEYRAGVESLQKRLMFLNIGLMPLLVAFAGIALALIKRRRMVRK